MKFSSKDFVLLNCVMACSIEPNWAVYLVVKSSSRVSKSFNLTLISVEVVVYAVLAALTEELVSTIAAIKSESFSEKLLPTYTLKEEGLVSAVSITKPTYDNEVNLLPPL